MAPQGNHRSKDSVFSFMKRVLLVASVGLLSVPSLPAGAETRGTIGFMRLMGRFGNGPSEIFTMGPGGRHRQRLTHNEVSESGPSFSPKGGRIAFSVGGATYDSDLFLMSASGKRRRSVADMPGGNGGVDWSPDGKLLVFHRMRPRTRGDIYTIRPNGRGLRRLTGGRVGDRSPTWSPDGDRIAFISFRGSGRDEVWTMDPDGGNFDRVTRNAIVCQSGCEARYGGFNGLAWAPGGDRLVFAANKGDGPSEIWIVNEDGSGLRRVTAGTYPAWSPYGGRIVYSYQGAIYKIKPDGTGRVRLTKKRNDYLPDWGA